MCLRSFLFPTKEIWPIHILNLECRYFTFWCGNENSTYDRCFVDNSCPHFEEVAKEKRPSVDKLNLMLFRIFYVPQIVSWIVFFPGFVIISSYGQIPEPLFLFDFMIMSISLFGTLIFGMRYDNTLRV